MLYEVITNLNAGLPDELAPIDERRLKTSDVHQHERLGYVADHPSTALEAESELLDAMRNRHVQRAQCRAPDQAVREQAVARLEANYRIARNNFV